MEWDFPLFLLRHFLYIFILTIWCNFNLLNWWSFGKVMKDWRILKKYSNEEIRWWGIKFSLDLFRDCYMFWREWKLSLARKQLKFVENLSDPTYAWNIIARHDEAYCRQWFLITWT
jgi:hypothetical protein